MPFDGPDGYEIACRAAALALRPRVQLWPSQWAEKNRVLSPKSSSEPVRWRNSRVPYATAIMDALDLRHPAWMVVFPKASQVAATEVGLNWAGHMIDEDPGPMLSFFPGQGLGKRWVRDRLEPMIALTPSLLAKIPLGRSASNPNTLKEKHFPDGLLSVRSANVAIDMASTSGQKLMLDEVDRMAKTIANEGDPVEIIIRRAAAYAGRKKVYLNSSPTIESLSHINPWWLLSSQGRYEMPCPHCNAMQHLVWSNLSWLPGKPRDAQYMCAHCAALIPEHHKTDMLAAGGWRHTFPAKADEIIGFHVNCLYTPIGLGDSWGENAEAYERAQGDAGKLKVFVNTRLGETEKDPNEKIDWEVLSNRREPYPLRQIPQGCLRLTFGADVQKDRIEVQIVGWSRGPRRQVIDYKIIYGDPTRDEIWQALDDYLAQEFLSFGGVKMRLEAGLVDSGYLQDEVLAFTRGLRARNIFASKGSSQLGRQAIGKPTLVDVKGYRAKTDRRGAEQYQIGVSTLKEALYERLRADAGSAEQPVAPIDRHYAFSDQLPEDYFRGVCSEVFDPHKRRWVRIYERNEPLDTLIQNEAVALHHSMSIDKMSELDWQRLEMLYEPKAAPTIVATPALPTSSSADRRGFPILPANVGQ